MEGSPLKPAGKLKVTFVNRGRLRFREPVCDRCRYERLVARAKERGCELVEQKSAIPSLALDVFIVPPGEKPADVYLEGTFKNPKVYFENARCTCDS